MYGQTTVPTLATGLRWAAVAAGWNNTCGLDSAGGLACWGLNVPGQTVVPTLDSGLTWKAVGMGMEHICGIDSASRMRCWGSNEFNQTDVPSLGAGLTWLAAPAPSSLSPAPIDYSAPPSTAAPPSPPSSSGSSMGPIIGGVVGGIAVIGAHLHALPARCALLVDALQVC